MAVTWGIRCGWRERGRESLSERGELPSDMAWPGRDWWEKYQAHCYCYSCAAIIIITDISNIHLLIDWASNWNFSNICCPHSLVWSATETFLPNIIINRSIVQNPIAYHANAWRFLLCFNVEYSWPNAQYIENNTHHHIDYIHVMKQEAEYGHHLPDFWIKLLAVSCFAQKVCGKQKYLRKSA